MILVNGNWEDVQTFEDALALVRENMGIEFANRLEVVCEKSMRAATGDLRNQIEAALATIDNATTLLEAQL